MQALVNNKRNINNFHDTSGLLINHKKLTKKYMIGRMMSYVINSTFIFLHNVVVSSLPRIFQVSMKKLSFDIANTDKTYTQNWHLKTIIYLM